MSTGLFGRTEILGPQWNSQTTFVVPTSTPLTATLQLQCMIAQHNQQSTSVEAHHVTVNITAFSGEPRHEKDISGRTVPIRVINPDKKSEYKTYTLRNLSSYSFTDLSHLKKEIASQLGDKVSSDPCSSVGYYKGQTRFWI